MIYLILAESQPAADFPNELPTLCRPQRTVESATLWGGWRNSSNRNTVIDALLSVAKRQPYHINGLEWEKYAATVHRRGKTGEPLFLIARDFAKYCQVSGYGVAIAAAQNPQCENHCKHF